MSKYALEGNYKTILKIALPIMGSNFIHLLVSFVDTAFAGRIDEQHLAAVGVGGIFYQFFFMVCFGIVVGFRIKFSHFLGSNRYKSIKILFSNTMFLIGIAAVLLFLLGQVSAYLFFIRFSKHSYDVIIHNYISVRLFTIFIVVFHIFFRAYFIAVGKTFVLVPAGILMTLVNASLNYLFLFGALKGTFQPSTSLAIASLIAETSSTLLMFSYYKIKKYILLEFDRSLITFRYLKNFLLYSFPLSLQYTIAFGGWLAFILMMERAFDAFFVASGTLLIQLSEIVEIPIWAMAAATNSIVSNLLGQKRHKLILKTIQRTLLISIVSAGILYFFVYTFSEEILRLYSNDVEIIRFTSRILIYLIPALVMHSVGTIYFNAYLGFAKTLETLIIEIVSVGIYVLTGYLLIIYFRVPFKYIWLTGFVYWTGVWGMSYYYFKKEPA